MSLDAQGQQLLALVISRIAGVEELVRTRDCRALAEVVNRAMPDGLKLTPGDVYGALLQTAAGAVRMNTEQLRRSIDSMPWLYSARLSGAAGHQAILNELLRDTTLVPVPTLADVRAAMQLYAVEQPTRFADGAVRFVGRAQMG